MFASVPGFNRVGKGSRCRGQDARVPTTPLISIMRWYCTPTPFFYFCITSLFGYLKQVRFKNEMLLFSEFSGLIDCWQCFEVAMLLHWLLR